MLSLLLPRVPTDRAKSMIDDHDAWTRCKFLSSIHCEVLRRVSPSLDLSVRQLILAYALINATGISYHLTGLENICLNTTPREELPVRLYQGTSLLALKTYA